MKKTLDLTPKFNIPPAEQELMIDYIAGERPMGESAGGLALYSNRFKRGYGDKVFGNDENGLWLGKADFEDAPFRVDYDGNVVAESIALSSTDFASTGAGDGQVFTSSTETEVVDSKKTIVLERTTLVLVLINFNGYLAQIGVGDYGGQAHFRLLVDGVGVSETFMQAGKTGSDTNGGQLKGSSMHYLGSLSAGSHIIKATGRCNQLSGSSKFVLYGFRITYITLGGVL